jgi:hypothetical protein
MQQLAKPRITPSLGQGCLVNSSDKQVEKRRLHLSMPVGGAGMVWSGAATLPKARST